MTIYAQARNFIFKVGGNDFTNNLVGFTLSRPQTVFGTPKTWSGSFELEDTLDRDENELDAVANPNLWRRAQQVVTLEIYDVALTTYIKVFTGYISTYRYDRNPLNRRGSGTLIDELGLQMLAKNPELAIKEGVGTTPMWQLVKDLLVKGSNDADGTVNYDSARIFVDDASGIVGSTNVPYTSSVPIKSAQDILGVNQLWAYCDKEGDIRVKRFDWDATPAFTLTLNETITFDQDLTIEDYSAEKVVVSGSKQVSVPIIPDLAVGDDPEAPPNVDIGDGTEENGGIGAKGKPLRITTTETKELGEWTGSYKTGGLNGTFEVNLAVSRTKVIEYTYDIEGNTESTTTTVSSPLGIITESFASGGLNGTYEPLTYIVDIVTVETSTSKSITRPRGVITGSFANGGLNGTLEVTTAITSTETITNLSADELTRIKKAQIAPRAKYTDSDNIERNLYEIEPLPVPENKIETLTFKGEALVSLPYTPYFKVNDDRQFDYIENTDMAGALAAFIGRLEIARINAYLVEIAIPNLYLESPNPFLKCTIGEADYIIDGEQIELQDGKLSLIFTGLPV